MVVFIGVGWKGVVLVLGVVVSRVCSSIGWLLFVGW